MPRFFFHLRSPSGELVRDDQGVELPSLDSAAREAARTARSFDADRRRGGLDYTGWHFEVRSEAGSLNASAFLTEMEAA
jgi:hypothetical protein